MLPGPALGLLGAFGAAGGPSTSRSSFFTSTKVVVSPVLEASINGISEPLTVFSSSAAKALVKSNLAASTPGTCAETTPKKLSPI